MIWNAKKKFYAFFGDFGLRHKSISFTRWCHATTVMRSRLIIWYLYI